jgi:putative PIN family toxin of toxin-antitoxin system
VGKKVKVVFDTNVWISIFLQKALSSEYPQVKNRSIIYASPDILLEISKVLLYPKIADILKEAHISSKEVLRVIKSNVLIIEPTTKLNLIEYDPEDNKIVECALAAEADFIVTGDKHLLELGKFKKTKILKPREFLDLIG